MGAFNCAQSSFNRFNWFTLMTCFVLCLSRHFIIFCLDRSLTPIRLKHDCFDRKCDIVISPPVMHTRPSWNLWLTQSCKRNLSAVKFCHCNVRKYAFSGLRPWWRRGVLTVLFKCQDICTYVDAGAFVRYLLTWRFCYVVWWLTGACTVTAVTRWRWSER